MKKSAKIGISAATCIGTRSQNQDNLSIDTKVEYLMPQKHWCSQNMFMGTKKMCIFCVADGIGGESFGEIASMLCLSEINKAIKKAENSENCEFDNQKLKEILLGAVHMANQAVFTFFTEHSQRGGTTLTLAALFEDSFTVMNIGDSPAYIFSESGVSELTKRHNLAEERRRNGAEIMPYDDCILLHYIGESNLNDLETLKNTAEFYHGALKEGESILLCTDGVTNAFNPEHISKMLAEKNALDEIVVKASETENADNCTAVLLRCLKITQQ